MKSFLSPPPRAPARADEDRMARIEYGDEPAVFLIADPGEPLERARRTAALAGCRVAADLPVDRAPEGLRSKAASHPVLVELDAQKPGLTAMLGRLRDEAERGRRIVVAAPLALLDLAFASAAHANVDWLCEPSDLDRALTAAAAVAAQASPPRLHDAGRESRLLLQQLSEEVARIAGVLAAMSETERGEAPAARLAEEDDRPPPDPGFVRAIIRARRLRDQYLGPNLFADPAWDMMLDLMAARLERNRVAVSSLCIAAAVPPTTALRWIKALSDRGLFVRRADPRDGRRVYIELSDETARALAAYLRDVERLAPTAI